LDKDIQLAKVVFTKPEIFEGVHNLLVDKGKVKAKWIFSCLKDVPEDFVQKMLNTSDNSLLLDLNFL
jgi:hypothetical protein